MMQRFPSLLLRAATLLAAAGCQESGSPDSSASNSVDVSSAFNSLPVGFSNVQSTFDDSTGTEWSPGSGDGRGRHHDGLERGSGMMCGGLGGFLDLGLRFGDRRFPDVDLSGTCEYDPSTGRVACAPETRDGLTVTRSAAFSDATGAVQQAFDSASTNTVNVQVQVTGTKDRRDGTTITVQHASDRTLGGLAQGSTERTVNGTSAGSETTAGGDTVGVFNAVRVIGDTIQGLVVPVSVAGASYPTAGTVIRSTHVTATYEGQTPSSSSRREVITFDGSSTAAVVITRDGETQNCTLALPSRQLTCS
jgi:hypothetical protein